MKVSKTENRFKTDFQQPKTSFPKKTVLTSLDNNTNLQMIAKDMHAIIALLCYEIYFKLGYIHFLLPVKAPLKVIWLCSTDWKISLSCNFLPYRKA